MTQSTGPPTSQNPLALVAREAAAKSSDPQEIESLLRSAEKIENAERQMQESLASLVETVARGKVEAEAIRKTNHLPTWVVVLVLTSLLAFLAFVALKHHV